MRLVGHDHASLPRQRPRGLQVAGDLDRLVRVGVVDADAVDLALELHATAGAGEGLQAGAQALEGLVQPQSGGQRRQRVEDVVAARDAQGHAAQLHAPVDDGEGGGTALQDHVDRADLGVLGLPHRDEAQVAGLGHGLQRGRPRVVDAGDEEAVTVDAADELGERGAVGLLGAPLVEVVGGHVGDDRCERGVDEERPVALVGLGHEERPRTGVGVAAGGGEQAADGVRRLRVAGEQRAGEQGGRGGLAVRAGDGDHPAAGHRGGQAGRARQEPQPASAGLGHLRVVLAGRRGHHDRVAGPEVAEVLGGVAAVDRHAELAQAGEEGGVRVVGPGDLHAGGRHDPCDR